ncbi:50S ribosomal protein L24 [Patescibacteria group bacterium]|nr:50S ribosomal protein L24 [Patescibacteria group bacterium]MBU4078015.1 50S ribosomal protein L24 [Patescibacteria group bacterium]
MKIRKGDTILVRTGNDRGRTGKVMKVFIEKSSLLVEGINIQKKHRRPRKEGEKGQIVEKPGLMSISNVQIICPKCNKSVRVGVKVENKKKKRVCKKCNESF